jgi:uncharacterized protein (DUF2236 family)
MPFTPYTSTRPDDPAREDGGLFGPGSVTWRIMSSRIMWVAALRALYLRALHPRVIRGTLQNAPGITHAVGIDPTAAPASMAELDAYYEQIRPRLYASDEAKQALRVIMLPPVPDGDRVLKLGMPPVSALAFSTLPRWARRLYGRPDGPLSEAAATAGLLAVRLAFSQQRLFSGAMRAAHRAESAGEVLR